jgi:creatinine amidohydrolase
VNLEEMRPAEIHDAVQRGIPLLLPVGVLEYHGWHLPVGVDLLVTRSIARRVSELIEVVVAPALPYGPGVSCVGTPEMGSVEVGYPAYLPYAEKVLLGLVRMGFRDIFALCHHQGTEGEQGLSMRLAAQHLWASIPADQHPAWWGSLPPEQHPRTPNIRVISTIGRTLAPEYRMGDHAGYLETSLIRGICEDWYDAAELDRREPWFSQRTPHPSTTTPERSKDIFEAWARSVADEILVQTGRET